MRFGTSGKILTIAYFLEGKKEFIIFVHTDKNIDQAYKNVFN